MELNNVSTTLNVQVVGGNGGDTDNSFDGINCVGPGGGGSGGLLWVNAPVMPGGINLDAAGGSPGKPLGKALAHHVLTPLIMLLPVPQDFIWVILIFHNLV